MVLVETAAMRRVQAPSRGGLDLSINHLDSPTGGLSSAGMRDVRLLPRRARRRPLWLRSLARSRPVSEHWGADRGLPIDRHYIEEFLHAHRADIRGRVLEIKNSHYTLRFGHEVIRRDVLDIDAANAEATVVADLSDAPAVTSGTFDCFILTQTLQFIYRFERAVSEAHRLLAGGGVLLATVPVVSRIDRHAGAGNEFWRFTPAACEALFGSVFGPERVTVQSYGNLLAAVGFLTGLACEDVGTQRLDERDELYPVLVGVRAQKR